MSGSNIINILTKKSIEIIKKDGFKGYFTAIKKYYQSYPPLRKNLYYWFYSKLKRKKLIIKEIQGSKMYLNLDDFGLSKYLFLNGIREPECTKIMKQELKEGMTIVEIGANIGYYALIEASIIGKTGKIYAIEPFPSNFKLLGKNIDMNYYNDIVELHQLAISDKSGTTKLYVSDKHNLCNMLETDADGCVEVPAVTFDEFISSKKMPDMIRMDIEGFEYFILDGMKKTMKKCKSCKMFIEVHPFQMYEKGLDYKKPIQTLFDFGFKPTYVVKEHGPQKEESFEYKKPINEFFNFLKEIQLLPPENTHGFGLFLVKTEK